MKTSSFLSALRAHPALPLAFRAGREVVSPGYHLTEVKRVGYETMDCGAELHRWAETQFEIWVPPGEQPLPGRGHLPAGKFLRIIAQVETRLALEGDAEARVHASFAGGPAALWTIEAVTARDGTLWVDLSPDQTRCKAAERRRAAAAAGCCGSEPEETGAPGLSAAGGCGCGAPARAESAACCA